MNPFANDTLVAASLLLIAGAALFAIGEFAYDRWHNRKRRAMVALRYQGGDQAHPVTLQASMTEAYRKLGQPRTVSFPPDAHERDRWAVGAEMVRKRAVWTFLEKLLRDREP